MSQAAVDYINAAYPNSPQLDRGPILSNMRRWAGRMRGTIERVGVSHG